MTVEDRLAVFDPIGQPWVVTASQPFGFGHLAGGRDDGRAPVGPVALTALGDGHGSHYSAARWNSAARAAAAHPDSARFADVFSGSERTAAEYLLAEVLDRQSERVRLLLLRTSVLERVNGELAGLLTGDEGGERVLQDLEEAASAVVAGRALETATGLSKKTCSRVCPRRR